MAPITLPLAPTFPKEGELAQRIADLIHEYDGEISLVAVLGVLEIAKHQLLQEA